MYLQYDYYVTINLSIKKVGLPLTRRHTFPSIHTGGLVAYAVWMLAMRLYLARFIL
jgi:hypothetical protein